MAAEKVWKRAVDQAVWMAARKVWKRVVDLERCWAWKWEMEWQVGQWEMEWQVEQLVRGWVQRWVREILC